MYNDIQAGYIVIYPAYNIQAGYTQHSPKAADPKAQQTEKTLFPFPFTLNGIWML